jgi:hypothetical protein
MNWKGNKAWVARQGEDPAGREGEGTKRGQRRGWISRHDICMDGNITVKSINLYN